ncbi:MAG: hypothetical protein FWC44_02770, partial [Methanomassiliicoccaceae archaeon]|nr:hypothetical protein [Methanomassiliicoccaceae archaeon]
MVASILMVAGIAGVLLTEESANYSSADDWRLPTYITPSQLVYVKQITVTGGTITLDPGYVYRVEIAGGGGGYGLAQTGGTQSPAGPGGVVWSWLSLDLAESSVSLKYTAGGAGAAAGTTGGGGAGGGGNAGGTLGGSGG